MIYIDDLLPWPGPPAPGAERYFGHGKRSCHLWCDVGEEEQLHNFAKSIGLMRKWHQDEAKHFVGHYDLTPAKRRLALKGGAVLGDLAVWMKLADGNVLPCPYPLCQADRAVSND